MNNSKYKVLIIASHPVPYSAPLFRLMAQHPKLDILVAYCSLQGAEPGLDSGFGVEVAWDVPLLDGYHWVQIPNQSPQPGLGRFFGLINLDLWKQIRTGGFDAVVAYTGYAYASFWVAATAAKSSGTALLFGTDAHELSPRDRTTWKENLKKLLLPWIFGLADTVIVPSSGGVKYINSLGIPEQRIKLTPYAVNNEWWIAQAKQVNRAEVRQKWNIPEHSPVILFCAKLQPWKRPQDALRAFAKANVSESYLVFAGEGPLRSELEVEAKALGIAERIRFLGFVNQSQLPSVYRTADLFVFSSEYEPFGVVVNEAMLCGCPVVVSDRIGARHDLVQHGETGFVYSCGDVDALAKILQVVLPDSECLHKMSVAAAERMKTWSPQQNIESLVQALEKTLTS
ncbi:glycosyltransferase family 4 protein [Fischerella sp. PCC 9605]|uniref:glycosyltransferase family 4 protein n=1 Tax=Fischerella sp. PCC 9605 TaxID=1173024 RepID=UPI00047A274E|nr:glycosyltransferase family 4 protein [Fischerella sp. PCC 9605]